VPVGELLLIAGAVLVAGLFASLVAGRLRLPSLLLFLGVGMLVGEDAINFIDFDDFEAAQRVGVIALALILFEGGLSSGLEEIRPVLRPAVALATVGTILTAAITGLLTAWLFDLDLLVGLLIGAILSPTDGAAVFAMLRGSTLRRRLARTLEGEAGLNDPIAILLVVGLVEWIDLPGYGLLDMLGLLVSELAIGGVVGVIAGWLAVRGFRVVTLESPGLYPVASIAAAIVSFGAAATLGGSGFLAVYIVGLALADSRIPAKRTITAFHQGVAWVAQIVLFFTLGILVTPSELGDVWVEGTVIALIVVLVARPAAVFATTTFDKFSVAERVMLGWAGLRGAIPVVLATFAVLAGIDEAGVLFNIAFFAVLISTLLQGTTFEPLARRLGVTTSEPALPRPLTETGVIRRLGAEVVEYPVSPEDAVVGARVRDLRLPREALVNVIVRGDQAIPPRGSTQIESGDRLHVLLREEVAPGLEKLLERWRTGPIGPPAAERPAPRSAPSVMTRRPWLEEDGDPAMPEALLDVDVVDILRIRRDEPGALVLLEDGRYGITGKALAVGPRGALGRYARDRLSRAKDPTAQAWWQDIIGALSR
jgi:potassium/hydrogen antiporter